MQRICGGVGSCSFPGKEAAVLFPCSSMLPVLLLVPVQLLPLPATVPFLWSVPLAQSDSRPARQHVNNLTGFLLLSCCPAAAVCPPGKEVL